MTVAELDDKGREPTDPAQLEAWLRVRQAITILHAWPLDPVALDGAGRLIYQARRFAMETAA